MKLYYEPITTSSRSVMMFMADSAIPYEPVYVDLMNGEHQKEPYATLNPNRLVPLLDDDGFLLTESSSIMKYLADKFRLPSYPTDLKQRAKVNELMDWFNTGFYNYWGYNMIYPQVAPNHRRSSDEAQAVTVAWGWERSVPYLDVLNGHLIGPDKTYLCGSDITIADYLGASVLSLGYIVNCKFTSYPNIDRWISAMEARPNWAKVHEPFNTLAASLRDMPFVNV